MKGIPDKEREAEFKLKITKTTQIISIFVSLVLLGQEDICGYKYKAP